MRGSLYTRVSDRVHLGAVVATVALLAFGTVMVWSATYTMPAHDSLVQRHLVGIAFGLLPLAFLWALDYQVLKAWTGPLMVALSLLIIAPRIPGLGDSARGATSWLQFAGIRLFQPSEPAKLIFIVVMAGVIAEFGGKIETRAGVARVAGFASIPLVLILLQPDLGTGIVFLMTAVGMLLIGGLKRRWFAISLVGGVLLVGMLFGANDALNRMLGRGPYDPAYIAAVRSSDAAAMQVRDSSVLIKQYQINRLLVFVDPTRDPYGAGYNLAQSKIAIGSGGLTGQGLKEGSQSKLNFIPERHTDFIFSVLGEQLGFLGALMLLGLYLALLVAALSISVSSRDLFGALVAAGLISMWAFQVLENVGMCIGVMPITGIPLPFMSFGSSAMVTNLAGVGMLLSIWSRRYGTTTT